MKKSLILAGMLCIGYASAQEERVGINTETPSATLNVKTKTDAKSAKNLELENQAGTKLMTVLNNGYVGVNYDKPVGPLHIVSPGKGYGNDIIIEDYTSTAGDASALIFNRNRGTIDTPEVLRGGDNVGQIIFATKEGVQGPSALAGGTIRNVEIGANYTGSGKGEFYIKTSGNNSTRLTVLDTGDVKIHNLTGAGDRPVYADANGVLKIGAATATSTTATNGVQNTANMACDEANRGKMNFVKDVTLAGGGKADAFAVCLKGSDGKHYWRYLYGAGGETNGSGNFGAGLQ